MKTRLELINESKRIRSECQQILIDCEYWNTSVRKEHESAIDPDPDGELKRAIESCDEILSDKDFMNGL